MKKLIVSLFLIGVLTAKGQNYHFVDVPQKFQNVFLPISDILSNTDCTFRDLDFNNIQSGKRKSFQDSTKCMYNFYDSMICNSYYAEMMQNY